MRVSVCVHAYECACEECVRVRVFLCECMRVFVCECMRVCMRA